MYSRRQQKLIDRISRLGSMPRRRLLQGVGALGLAGILRPTAVFAESDDDDERLGPFGPWFTPVNLGPVVNSSSNDRFPAISKNGLSLYISSDRPGGVNGPNNKVGGPFLEIWVSQRASLDAPWQAPVNLDAHNSQPVINWIGSNTSEPNFSPDGHQMFFNTGAPISRPGGCGGEDLWVSRRANKRDDFGWQEPVNLGCTINSPFPDAGPLYFEDEETGIITMYFSSARPPAGPPGHIYISTLGDDGAWGPAILVPELSSPFLDSRTAIRRDGLEMFLSSTRPGGVGVADIWVSTRETTADLWSTPVTVGAPVNQLGSVSGGPELSSDGTTLYFSSTRPGFGAHDLYVTTRRNLREHEEDAESAHRRD